MVLAELTWNQGGSLLPRHRVHAAVMTRRNYLLGEIQKSSSTRRFRNRQFYATQMSQNGMMFASVTGRT